MGEPLNVANAKIPGFRCPHSSPGPWRGNPLRVKRRGNQERRHRPPSKLTHVPAARENAGADFPRGEARKGKGNRVCARKGPLSQRRGPYPRQKGGKV